MLTKIKYRLLGKAIWEVTKFPLLGIAVATLTILYTGFLISMFGAGGILLLIPTGLFIILIFVVQSKYKELVRKHEKEQKDLVDVLTR